MRLSKITIDCGVPINYFSQNSYHTQVVWMSYDDTLFLPKTGFPMRAGLTKKEPLILQKWEKEKTYEKVLEKHKDGAKDYSDFTISRANMDEALRLVADQKTQVGCPIAR